MTSTLHDYLIRLRLVLYAEAPYQLNTHAAPILRDREGITEQTDEGGIGLPLSAAMHRYLSHPDHWGLSRLGMSSIMEISEHCAARHPDHRRPLFTRTVCGQLAFEAGYLGQNVEDLCWLHPELSREQITGLLLQALKHAEEWREDVFYRATRSPEPAPTPERRPYRVSAA